MKPFNKITIIGVGLIGGSIGLAVKKRGLAKVVCGVGRRISSLKTAKKRGAVDTITLNLAEGLKDADLIIIATPINLVPYYAASIAAMPEAVKKDLIITDVGSTKDFIVSSVEKILPKALHFVGCHPFAGSEKNGAVYSSADLFCGAKTFLTPAKNTDKAAVDKLKRFWQALGSITVIISPEKHDKLVSAMSHMPHVLAAALVNSISSRDVVFASSGFCDTTRIAAGEPLLWRDVCLSNSVNILKSINKFKSRLDIFLKAMQTKNGRLLLKQFEAAKKKREKLN